MLKCKKAVMIDHLSWLIQLIKSKDIETPKTLIFCNGTMTDVATLDNLILMELGKKAYSPEESQNSENCIIGIYP